MNFGLLALKQMIALISGSKNLPIQLHDYFIEARVPHCCVLFENNLNKPLIQKLETSNTPYIINQIGQLRPFFKFLKQHNVNKLIFSGSIDRKKINPLHFDTLGLKWLFKIGGAFFKGDDNLLQSLIKLLQKEQFEIVPASYYLKDLFTDVGNHASLKISCDRIADAQYGFDLLHTLSPFDVGQAVIVDRGKIIGIEGPEGTEQLIQRCKDLLTPDSKAILVKASKKNQSHLIDMPTIGPETFTQAHQCMITGIAIEALKVQVLDLSKCIEIANQNNMYFYSMNNQER
ncbi:MAG: hypothetical protein C0432_02425 [Candidatus Puniceispirillum sp.]|nr:hypothetical protein [Candidatus Pelagibacter sp.]MBA4283131.1 hypothetical protein [Candidatus Puniceispirillum sp.]